MNKVCIVLLTLILTMAVGLGGCITVSPPGGAPAPAPTPAAAPTPTPEATPSPVPPPPEVPSEVLSIWKSPPVSEAYPPDVSGEVTLLPNRASGDRVERENITLEVFLTRGAWQDSMDFHLDENQWVDVIASSTDTLIYYLTEEPGAAHLHTKHITWVEVEHSDKPYRQQCSLNPQNLHTDVFLPFYFKTLYENHVTSTDKGPLYTTAIRMFAWRGEGDYCVQFSNFSRKNGCEITYRIYMDGTTPSWGQVYKETELQPWLNELYYMLVSGEITEEEYDEAESRWLEQFK